MGFHIPTDEGAILRAKGGRPITYLHVQWWMYSKMIQQGAAAVRCGCWLGCTRWGRTWTQAGKWTVCVQRPYVKLLWPIAVRYGIAVADSETLHDIELRRPASSAASRLSFVTSYKEIVVCIAISSSSVKNSDSYMPSAISSDNGIQVHSSMHLNNLADSVADCISKQTDAYTMLVDAVWHSIEEGRDKADQTAWAVCDCWNTAACRLTKCNTLYSGAALVQHHCSLILLNLEWKLAT